MPTIYGRARRITFFKILGFLIGIILLVFFVVISIFKKPVLEEVPPDFYFMTNYMKSLGYSCENLEKSGGRCTLKKVNYTYFFQRFDDGFTFITQSPSYEIEIKHVKNLYSEIILITNEQALEGYRNKKYYCSTNSYLIGELSSCVTNTGEKLTLGTYIGAVESSLEELKNILVSSSFDMDSLFREYIWKKETNFG